MKHPLNPTERGLLRLRNGDGTHRTLTIALSAWPVISLMHNGAQARPWQLRAVRA